MKELEVPKVLVKPKKANFQATFAEEKDGKNVRPQLKNSMWLKEFF